MCILFQHVTVFSMTLIRIPLFYVRNVLISFHVKVMYENNATLNYVMMCVFSHLHLIQESYVSPYNSVLFICRN